MAESDVPNWLNSSFLETALRSGGYGPSVTVTASEIGRATGPGDNYACEIYRAKLQVTLEGRRSTVTLIVKAQPLEGEMCQVNILFCLVIYIRDIPSILNRKTLSIFLLHIQLLYVYIYMYIYTYIYMCVLLIDIFVYHIIIIIKK
jgi:hypothetical protein